MRREWVRDLWSFRKMIEILLKVVNMRERLKESLEIPDSAGHALLHLPMLEVDLKEKKWRNDASSSLKVGHFFDRSNCLSILGSHTSFLREKV